MKRKLNPSKELRPRIEQLWAHILPPGHPVWKGTVGESKERNALELICGALWHIEFALQFGDCPKECIQVYRDRLRKTTRGIAWERWLKAKIHPEIKNVRSGIRVEYKPLPGPRGPFIYLIQSMLIADANLRVAAACDILDVLTRKKVGEQLIKKDGEVFFKDNTNQCLIDAAFVHSFRDWYMHGESPGKTPENSLWMFREQVTLKKNFYELTLSSLSVCEKLVGELKGRSANLRT